MLRTRDAWLPGNDPGALAVAAAAAAALHALRLPRGVEQLEEGLVGGQEAVVLHALPPGLLRHALCLLVEGTGMPGVASAGH